MISPSNRSFGVKLTVWPPIYAGMSLITLSCFGGEMTRFVVCYDIADDKRRQRVSQILDAYGDRIQGSVFEPPDNHQANA